MRSLAAVHLAGNALLLWLGYYWLGLGEARASALVWSAVVALLVVCGACWLHGATFAYFSVAKRRLGWALRMTLPRLALLTAAALAVLAAYFLLARWAEYSSRPAFVIASFLTKTLRKPVKPSSVLGLFHGVLWLVRWMVVPVMVLPVLARIATGQRRRRSWFYWMATPVLLLGALWAPLALLNWKPHMGSFGFEMFSFVVRLLIAYLLFVAAWLMLEFVTSGGSPRETQSRTVASP